MDQQDILGEAVKLLKESLEYLDHDFKWESSEDYYNRVMAFLDTQDETLFWLFNQS